ncbi:MAG: TonB-dependent receptor [Candidatus Cloacimonetes bacterium]|nr:TonB-dependent receptor [Candidatus Cloacimonadota bacterium]
MKKALFIALILLLCFISYAAEAGRIFGIVRSAKTGDPLQMVAVKVTELKTGGFTDNSGKYLIQDIAPGNYNLSVELIGYKSETKAVTVNAGETLTVNFELKISAVSIGGSSVSANRAIKRETPIAFTNISEQEISDKYTTEDMPQLLEDVPGLFASTTGMGDSEITMRGFDADKIQVLINGIPVNDPESQKVYWSNWTGLTSSVKSVQVQKGAGSSLYGSGAFGGSLNIETIGSKQEGETTLRTSYSSFTTDGDVADGKGDLTSYSPYNYNVLVRHTSGALFGGKFNYSLMAERKVGDYYIEGTNYRGWSFGLETQNVVGGHKLSTSFLGAPQSHNQVYFKSDPKLMETLGREYNRNNTKYQENYYFKPQFSIRDEWEIDDNKVMMTNLFITKGNGGGKYISNDKFDINTGEIFFQDNFLTSDDPQQFEDFEFGKHALYLYKKYGYVSEDFVFDGVDNTLPFPIYGPTYKGKHIYGPVDGADFFSGRYDYSWINNNVSDHFQVGLNTYYEQDVSENLNMVFGGELRNWSGTHIGNRENFRHYYDDPDSLNFVEVYDTIEKNYDYTTNVLNMSAFARFKYKPAEEVNIMFDGQIARYASKVDENPIEIYDLGTGEPTGIFYYDTKDLTEVVDGDTLLKFSKDDYEKVYSFFSPKVGINYNISQYFNIRSNYSIAYKEPKTSEWYGYDGPDTRQLFEKNIVLYDSLGVPYDNDKEETFYGELKPERINTLEFGVGYEGDEFNIDVNYYISDYTDKIESADVPVTEEYYNVLNDSIEIRKFDAALVINAGQARHQGIEISMSGFPVWLPFASLLRDQSDRFDSALSITLANYRWTKMNVEEIFKTSAEDMKGKVVPYSPEKMASASLGYTIPVFTNDSKLRFGINAKYWDEYYSNYTNEYFANYIENSSGAFVPDSTSITSSKLPYFFEMGADVKYSFLIGGKEAFLKLGFNNILNRENYSSARVSTDYNRGYFDEDGKFVDDYLTDNEYMYVTPSPLFSAYLTMELKF